MDPTEKNWISKYLDERSKFALDLPPNKSLSSSELIYKVLQPTGILYGHPLSLPIPIDTTPWPLKERLEVILLESFISSYLIYNKIDKATNSALREAVNKSIEFYEQSFPELLKRGFLEMPAKTPELQLEKIISKRILVKPEWNAHFWRGFFHNILLFVDILTFIEFMEAGENRAEINWQKRILEFQYYIIHLLAVITTLNSDKKESVNLYNYFVSSTNFSKKEKEDFQNNYRQPEIQKVIQFLGHSSWLVRKYFLELGLLSIWADNTIDTDEQAFIEHFESKLQLDSIEIETSSFAVESYVFLNWEKVHYLQSKQSLLVLSKRMTHRMKKISHKYAHEIKAEINENKELINLLRTSQKRPLSIDEREKVRQQLIDVLKTIPAFVVLAMPMAFLSVPILMKVLPKNIFPSSFNPNKIVNQRGNKIIEG